MSIWFISDTHFHHANILRFTGMSGQPLRNFSSVEEMNEHMVDRWNEVVKPGDKVYHLGDVSFRYGEELASIMGRLRGQKRLILGNHDQLKGTNLASFFQKVVMWRVFRAEGFVCSHVPLHRGSFPHQTALNVHGHIHERVVPDPQYMNVSVEVTDYRPVHMDEIMLRIKQLT